MSGPNDEDFESTVLGSRRSAEPEWDIEESTQIASRARAVAPPPVPPLPSLPEVPIWDTDDEHTVVGSRRAIVPDDFDTTVRGVRYVSPIAEDLENTTVSIRRAVVPTAPPAAGAPEPTLVPEPARVPDSERLPEPEQMPEQSDEVDDTVIVARRVDAPRQEADAPLHELDDSTVVSVRGLAPLSDDELADETVVSPRQAQQLDDDTVMGVRRAPALDDDTVVGERRQVDTDDLTQRSQRSLVGDDATQISARKGEYVDDTTELSTRNDVTHVRGRGGRDLHVDDDTLFGARRSREDDDNTNISKARRDEATRESARRQPAPTDGGFFEIKRRAAVQPDQRILKTPYKAREIKAEPVFRTQAQPQQLQPAADTVRAAHQQRTRAKRSLLTIVLVISGVVLVALAGAAVLIASMIGS